MRTNQCTSIACAASLAMLLSSVASAQAPTETLVPVYDEDDEIYTDISFGCSKDGYLINGETTYSISETYAANGQPEEVLPIVKSVGAYLSKHFTKVVASSTKSYLQGIGSIQATFGKLDSEEAIHYKTTMTYGDKCTMG